MTQKRSQLPLASPLLQKDKIPAGHPPRPHRWWHALGLSLTHSAHLLFDRTTVRNLPAPSPGKYSGHSHQALLLRKWLLDHTMYRKHCHLSWLEVLFVYHCELMNIYKCVDNSMKRLLSIYSLKKPLSNSLSVWEFYFKTSPVNLKKRLLSCWWEGLA